MLFRTTKAPAIESPTPKRVASSAASHLGYTSPSFSRGLVLLPPGGRDANFSPLLQRLLSRNTLQNTQTLEHSLSPSFVSSSASPSRDAILLAPPVLLPSSAPSAKHKSPPPPEPLSKQIAGTCHGFSSLQSADHASFYRNPQVQIIFRENSLAILVFSPVRSAPTQENTTPKTRHRYANLALHTTDLPLSFFLYFLLSSRLMFLE